MADDVSDHLSANAASGEERGTRIYRSGGTNPGNFRMRQGESGVSFRDSLSNPIDAKANPPLKSGPYVVVDVRKLPAGTVRYDSDPRGHVTVVALPEAIRAAIVDKGKLP
ncbi:MAG TPA: hypothetical protein VHQ47_14590 [Phycisphaerae bacterium]|nr:hypothetical protein [Phycisphaerae bacterium]